MICPTRPIAALSIAVLHHIASPNRRRTLCAETIRVLAPGGLGLFYAWAEEQADGGVSGHAFASQDVFVPWHLRENMRGAQHADAAAHAPSDAQSDTPGADGAADGVGDGASAEVGAGAVYDATKRAYVYQRYCHVYRRGELPKLFEGLDGARVVREYYDVGNWCVLVEKTR